MTLSARLRDRRLWLLLAAIGAVALLRWTGLGELLSIEALRAHRATLGGWVAGNFALAAAAYVAIYALAVAVSMPGAVVLTISGGFLFGAFAGSFLAVAGATAGATLVFVFARAIFGPRALDRLGPQAARLAAGLRRDAASYLLALRLVPLFPFFLVNLVPAFAGVPLATYVATTAIGIVPGTTVFALAGAGLGSVLDRGGDVAIAAILTPEIVAGLAGLAALSLVAIPIRRRLERRDRDTGTTARREP